MNWIITLTWWTFGTNPFEEKRLTDSFYNHKKRGFCREETLVFVFMQMAFRSANAAAAAAADGGEHHYRGAKNPSFAHSE